MTGVFCNQCGHRNPTGSNFCSSCGAVLEPVGDDTTITFLPPEAAGSEGHADEIQVTLEDLPAGSGMLVVTRGPNAGSRFVLDTDVIRVGRHPQSDIFLDDVTVSRRHAEFVRTGGGYTVRDAGSLNGTYVNRQRTEEAELAAGDEVQVGAFKLVYFVGAGE